MGQPSFQASNAIVYVTYGAFLYDSAHSPVKMRQLTKDLILRVLGTALAWGYRKDSKAEFLSGNRTRTGQDDYPRGHNRR